MSATESMRHRILTALEIYGRPMTSDELPGEKNQSRAAVLAWMNIKGEIIKNGKHYSLPA